MSVILYSCTNLQFKLTKISSISSRYCKICRKQVYLLHYYNSVWTYVSIVRRNIFMPGIKQILMTTYCNFFFQMDLETFQYNQCICFKCVLCCLYTV